MRKTMALILICMAVCICIAGCGKEKKEEVGEEHTSTHTASSSDVQRDTKAKSWFDTKLKEYIEEKHGKEYKVFTEVEEVMDGAEEDTILKNVSATICIYFDAKDTDKEKASEFSDELAREFASVGALGNIDCSTYVTPSEVYGQIEEGNYKQVEEKAMLMDDYNKYSFDYTGLRDAMESNGGNAMEGKDMEGD